MQALVPLNQVVCTVLELAANKALTWSSNGQECLQPLLGKTCIINIQEFEQALIFDFHANSILVGADEDAYYLSSPDENPNVDLDDNQCWISISLFAIAQLKQKSRLTSLIKSGQLDFAGDLAILQALSSLFNNIDLDFEEVLAQHIGDVAAYQLNSSGQKVAQHFKQQVRLLSHTLADTAFDEKPIAVRKIMLLNFSDEVTNLTREVDSLETKVAALESIRARAVRK